jgi:hypothetical protein
MNPRIMPANSPPTIAGFSGHFQDMCSFAMDQAIGIEKASLTTLVSLNSSVLDLCKNTFWYAPVFSDLLDATARSLTFSMEMQMSWLTALAPLATKGFHTASSSDGPTRHEDDKLAESMDIALGAGVSAPSSTVPSNSDQHSQPAEEESEYVMDKAIGARAA